MLNRKEGEWLFTTRFYVNYYFARLFCLRDIFHIFHRVYEDAVNFVVIRTTVSFRYDKARIITI